MVFISSRSILVVGISLGIYPFYYMHWLPGIFITKCYKPEGLKTMDIVSHSGGRSQEQDVSRSL